MLTLVLPFRTTRRATARSRSSAVRGRWFAFDARRWNVAAIACLAVLTVGYLALTNENATGGYEVRTLERKAEILREEVQQLDLAAIDIQTMDRITARLDGQPFVPVAHVEYLTNRAVAKR